MPKKKNARTELPPWKRKANSTTANNNDVDVVVAAPPPSTAPTPAVEQEPKPVMPDESSGYGLKSEVPSTFQGERGGEAQDEELLALLRGVSSKSGASRFDDDDNNNVTGGGDSAGAVAKPEVPSSKPSEPKVVSKKNTLQTVAATILMAMANPLRIFMVKRSKN